MFDIEFKSEIARAKRELSWYERKIIPKAAASALNKTATTVRAKARPELAKEMGVIQAQVKDQFFINRATLGNLSAGVGVRHKPMALTKFKATRQLKRGVTSKAYGNRRLYPGAFIATMESGHTGVFLSSRKRGRAARIHGHKVSRSGHRYRSSKIVKQIYGPNPSTTFGQKRMTALNNQVATERFHTVFAHEIRWRRSKL